jgi:double-strand break repair protein MRE11
LKIDELVKEFLEAQSLTILPQNSFGDAVTQFVDKDDKDAMSQFVKESLETQMIHLLKANEVEEEDITNAMEEHRTAMETMFDKGQLRKPVSTLSFFPGLY